MFDCIIAGVGGQGSVLASKLIAAAAMKRGFNVRTTETIGMAQRGGSVVSHVRISAGNIFSPLIPLGCAAALIAFEPAEAIRCLPYLREQGKLIVCDSAVKPVAGPKALQAYDVQGIMDYLRNILGAVIIPGRQLQEQHGKTLNVALLGAAARCGLFPFEAATLQEVLPELLPQHFVDINIRAFEAGRKIYDETAGYY